MFCFENMHTYHRITELKALEGTKIIGSNPWVQVIISEKFSSGPQITRGG